MWQPLHVSLRILQHTAECRLANLQLWQSSVEQVPALSISIAHTNCSSVACLRVVVACWAAVAALPACCRVDVAKLVVRLAINRVALAMEGAVSVPEGKQRVQSRC